jgi:hypothetical protein
MRSQRTSQTNKYKLDRTGLALGQLASGIGQSFLGRLIGAGLLLSGAASLIGIIFQVKETSCLLDSKSCPPELSAYTQNLVGQSMFGVDYAAVLSQFEYPLPLKLTKTEKYLPNRAVLQFETQALAYKLKSGDQVLTVSEVGQVFSDPNLQAPLTIALTPALETILVDQTHLKPELHSCLQELSSAFAKAKIPPGELSWLDKDTITLIMNGEQQTVFLDCEKPSQQLHNLTLILAAPEFQEKSETIKEIDLRFELPVLRTST